MSLTSSRASRLTAFSLVMITVGSVDSIRNLPATALFGSQLIFFYLIGTLLFLIPSALVSAELSSNFPKQGGVYVWVSHALGRRAGLVAIWLQWVENVIWYPTLLSFVAGTLGFLISPQLVENPHFLIATILVSFWSVTLLNYFGIATSARFSSFCTLTGLLLPMALIIALGSHWIISGKPQQISFHWHDILPQPHQSDMWISLTAIMMSFCGIEIATVHAKDVHNPKRNFPYALAWSVLIILVTLVLGSLAIAIVLPHEKISLVAGIMQAFETFFNAFHLPWVLPLIAITLVIGGLGNVNNWIIAPIKGLLVAAEEGALPAVLQKQNRHGAPVVLLFLQAILVSALSAAFLFMPTVNSAYWFLNALGAQLYMVMYLLMFITGIVLRRRYAQPQKDTFTIPGGKWGTYLTCLVGIIGTTATIFVSFVPPNQLGVFNEYTYVLALLLGISLMILPPLLGMRGRQTWTVLRT